LEGRGRCKKPGLLVGRKEKGLLGPNFFGPERPDELGFIPLSAIIGDINVSPRLMDYADRKPTKFVIKQRGC
jgi:hypothetical protein